MSRANPLHSLQEQAGAGFFSFGEEPGSPQIIDSFGYYEAEYAALRKGVAIFHAAQRGLLQIAGKDRADFLHRFLTNDVKGLAPGQACRSFLLDRTGRIQADVHLLAPPEVMFLDTDQVDSAALAKRLEQFLFSEDVQIRDLSSAWQRLSFYGPLAAKLLEEMGLPQASGLQNQQVVAAELATGPAWLYRHDDAGVPGCHLWLEDAGLLPLYQRLSERLGSIAPEPQAASPSAVGDPFRGRARAIGWLAYNTARIETGTPLYHVDFGPDSLAHEANILEQTVSFKKGCYLGQEIVARMQSLGHPKKLLVGLRFGDERMPAGGVEVYDVPAPAPGAAPGAASAAAPAAASGAGSGGAAGVASGGGPAVIGAVTSATLSPMLGNLAIALAMIKWGKHRPGQQVQVPAEGARVPAAVAPLRFL